MKEALSPRKLPYGRPILRKLGAELQEEDFKLPSEYAESSDEEVSEFDPDAIYILPVIGEEHIYEKRKVRVALSRPRGGQGGSSKAR